MKPSERIFIIYEELRRKYKHEDEEAFIVLEAISQYLDEQEELTKQDGK